jgi:hypothetical protein
LRRKTAQLERYEERDILILHELLQLFMFILENTNGKQE